MSDLLQALSASVPRERLCETMQAISTSRFPQFDFLCTLNGGRDNFLRPNPSLKVQMAKSFRVPMRLSCARAKRETKIMDPKVFALNKFLNIRGNPTSPFDVIRVARNGVLTQDQVEEFVLVNAWGGGLLTSRVFAEISNPLSKGVLMSAKDHSYTKVKYPAGMPSCEGVRPSEACLFNREWNVVDQMTKDNRRYVPTDDEEVWIEEMFDIEDDNNQLDQQICRNLNVIRMLRDCQSAGMLSPMVMSELRAIYGPSGSLMVSLLDRVPAIAYPVVRKRLEKRFCELFATKVDRSAFWGQVWSKGRMKRRVMYQKAVKDQVVSSMYGCFPQEPIVFPVEHTHLLSYFIDKICADKDPEKADDLKEGVRKILVCLREPSVKEMSVSFPFLTAVCLGAQLIKLVSEMKVIDEASLSGVRIAGELGLTKPHEHGFAKIMLCLTKSVFRKGKRKDMEIPSLLFDLESTSIPLVEQTASLFWKSMKAYVENQDDVEIAVLRHGAGSVEPLMQIGDKLEKAQLNLDYLISGKPERRGPRS